MKRLALAVLGLGGLAHADKIEEPKPTPPDPVAEDTANESNLVSNVHHDKLSVTGAIGGGLILGDGVGRGAAGSFRIGFRHRSIVETLELNVGTLFHQPDGPQPEKVLHNDDVSVMGGIQYYSTPSLWFRGAAGLTVYTVESETTPPAPTPVMRLPDQVHFGGGALFGLGIDIVRLRHFVLDVEMFAVLSVVGTKGLMSMNGLCLGGSFY